MERLTKTGLVVPDRVPWGTHLCQFYETEDDLLGLLVPYFREGLAADEYCIWITSDPISVEEAARALRAAVPDFDRRLAAGQMEIIPHDRWYLSGGRFDIDGVLRAWSKRAETALDRGYRGLRVSGNAAALQEEHWAELAAYEEKVQSSLHCTKIVALCSYPLTKCTASQFFEVVNSHDCALVRWRGGWECMESRRGKQLLNTLAVKEHALASSISPLVMTDLAGNVTYANPAALKAWRYESESEILNRPAAEFCASPHELAAYLEQVRSDGSCVRELVARRKDGSTFDSEVMGSLTFDDRGRPIGMVASCQDLTARNEAEARRRESEDRYHTLVENIALGITLMDRNHKILAINRVHAEMVGRPADRCIGVECFRLFEKREAVCPHCPGTRAMKTGKAEEHETVGVRDDGTTYAARVQAFPVLGPGGEATGFIEVVEDVTARNAAQKQLAQFSAIVNSSQDAIIGGSLDGIVTSWNPGAEQLYGYAEEEMIGQPIARLLPADRPDETARLLARLQRGGRIEHFDTVRRRKDGTLLNVSITLSPIKDSLGRIIGASAIARDITDRKRAERELLDAKTAAEAANRAKSEFLANMSHEIRTPMTAILGFTDLLLEEAADAETLETCRIIQRNGEHLLHIINDILDLSKIEAGKHDPDFQTCSPRRIVAEVLGTMQVRADAKGLSVSVEFDDDVPAEIRTDPVRLRQILINLVGNAVKFTEVGGVRVVVRSERPSSPCPWLCFEIIDTGIGIAEENLPKLFKPFSQVDSSAHRRFGGTGLGLAISKRLARILGGDIAVSSTLGKGTTFTVTIDAGPPIEPGNPPHPAETLEAIRQPSAAETSALDCRVLLAEDGPDNQRLIAFMLRKAGAEVTVVENGREAVEHALEGAAGGRPFDVILMDMQMPLVDGYEATRTLREAGYRGPIVALTAHAMKEDREKCLNAGCDDYLAKPLNREMLLQRVARCAAAWASGLM